MYSTDQGRVRAEPARRTPPAAAPRGPRVPDDGVVRVSRTSSGRGGKTVTMVTGLPPGDVAAVGARLKRVCGSGGTVKDGVVEIQGDHRQRVVDHLSGTYRTKLAGG